MDKNTEKMFSFELDVLDWSVCIGGEHLTAKIKYYDLDNKYHHFELERNVGLKEAKILAEKDYGEGCRPSYAKLYRKTNRFNNYKELERFATKWCKEKAKEFGLKNWVLVYNDLHNPNIIVYGEGFIKDRIEILNKIAKDWDVLTDRQREQLWDSIYKVWKISTTNET